MGDLCHAAGMLTSSRFKQHHLKSSSYSELNFSCVYHEVLIKMLKTVFVVLRSLQDSLLLWHFSLLSSVDNKSVVKVMVPALQNEKEFFKIERGKKKKKKEMKQNKARKKMGRREGEVREEKCARKQYKKKQGLLMFSFPASFILG